MCEIILEKCPFCGGEAKIVKTHVYMDEARRVRCTQCYVVTPPVLINHPMVKIGCHNDLDESTRYCAEEAEFVAARLWNRRV